MLNSRAVELRDADRDGTALRHPLRAGSTGRTTSIRTCRRTIRSRSTPSRSTSAGYLDLPDGSRVGIVRAHIEEDTGKTTHMGGGGRIHDADYSLVDYNRAGVPLVEIVSEPDIRSAEQARLYAAELRGILVASGASDGRMEEGSMRIDANVSVRRSRRRRSSAHAAR